MLDGQLSAEDSVIVAEHLAECPECMRAFEAFHAVSSALGEMEDVPAGFTKDVMHRIHQSNETTTKKRPAGIFRWVSLTAAAACAALVLMAGTSFANTHMYVGGSSTDTAEYVHMQRATPTPASIAEQENSVSFISDDAATDTGDSLGNNFALINDSGPPENEAKESPPRGDSLDLTPQPLEAMDGEPPMLNPMEGAAPIQSGAPIPPPAVTATPMPAMDLLFLTDLLLVVEEADFDLFADTPAYEVTITADDGSEVQLKIWLDGSRIYCKDEAAGTAWYTFGTPAQLIALLGEPAAVPQTDAVS